MSDLATKKDARSLEKEVGNLVTNENPRDSEERMSLKMEIALFRQRRELLEIMDKRFHRMTMTNIGVFAAAAAVIAVMIVLHR